MTGLVIPDAGTIGSASDNDALAISSGGVVTASQSIAVDTISEKTSANGVVVDGVTLKDGGATFTGTVTGVPSSSKLVLIKTETAPTATTWTIEDTFSSDYDTHLLVFSDITIASAQHISMRLQYQSDGSVDTGSNYNFEMNGTRSGGHFYSITGAGQASFQLANTQEGSSKPFTGILWVNGALNTDVVTTMHGTFRWQHDSHSTVGMSVSYWFNSTGNLYDGIHLYSTANIDGGRVTSYGLKHS